jgi:hypothetical protein
VFGTELFVRKTDAGSPRLKKKCTHVIKDQGSLVNLTKGVREKKKEKRRLPSPLPLP